MTTIQQPLSVYAHNLRVGQIFSSLWTMTYNYLLVREKNFKKEGKKNKR
jgi:hypothetical protein